MDIEWGGEALTLFPDRAVFRPARGDLLIADPHFGKDAAFRRHGLPVPAPAVEEDLERLDRLLDTTAPARLVILGDFLHSRSGRTPEAKLALSRWRSRRPSCPILLIRGNHDRAAGDPPPDWDIRCVPEPHPEGALLYAHHPRSSYAAPHLAGHLHPGVLLRPARGPRIRLPCFQLTSHALVLPPFGSFTGLTHVEPAAAHRLYAIADPYTILPLPSHPAPPE